MIIPSIDIMNGSAVQLRQGRDHVLDGGDPFERLEEFSLVGEVAVVDLDAALGKGSNRDIIAKMARLKPIRVGGGIRNEDTAHFWLDAGAAKIMIGTKATAEFCSVLPKERIIAAVDAREGKFVTHGWTHDTNDTVTDKIRELAPFVDGFLFTQVEREGMMQGFDMEAVNEAIRAAGNARVVAAGGITTTADIATLDRLGADAQVGMALYSEALDLGDAVAECLHKPLAGDIWPTVVCDESGKNLGIVWSTRESLKMAIRKRRGIYWSRSRNEIWEKGKTSGNTQELLDVRLDCDRDALRFTVKQAGTGFCHTGRRACWDSTNEFSLDELEAIIAERMSNPKPNSGTTKLLSNPVLLEKKLLEEAGELAAATTKPEARHEAADLLYFLLVAARKQGVTFADIQNELRLRNLRVSRRAMESKEARNGDSA
ncbi:MAG: phosphoribosyl-ATP diphosphatase [Gemmatimonadota bacterium]|nr:phosphoribosyl-ATP diphosphatase [Gemmatimonadota bacterium]